VKRPIKNKVTNTVLLFYYFIFREAAEIEAEVKKRLR
jgi:hypothetical protein